MTRDDFVTTGRAIFGREWQGPLSAATGIKGRSIREMVARKRPIPPRLSEAMSKAVQTLALIAEIASEHGTLEEINITGADDLATRWTRSLVVAALRKEL